MSSALPYHNPIVPGSPTDPHTTVVTEEERAGSATCISCDLQYNHYNEMRCHQPYPTIIPLYLSLLPTHIPLLLLRKRELVQLLSSILCDLQYNHYNEMRCHQPYPTIIPLYLSLLPTHIPLLLLRKRERESFSYLHIM